MDYLLAPGRGFGVPIVLTCRSEDEAKELTDWLQRVHRIERVCRLDLAPLAQAETAEQIGLMLGHPPPQRFVAHTYACSEGKAFFTEQLVAFARPGLGSESTLGVLVAGLMSLLLARTGIAREIMSALAVAPAIG